MLIKLALKDSFDWKGVELVLINYSGEEGQGGTYREPFISWVATLNWLLGFS